MSGAADISLPQGYGLRFLKETDSTNEDARRMGRTDEAGPVWILAESQRAGRGRRARHWVSPKGNLHATLFLRPDCSPARAAQLSFVAALSALFMAQRLLPADMLGALGVKWPNDVLLKKQKLGGILLESDSAGREMSWLAIGIGINLAHKPEIAPTQALLPPIALSDVMPAPSPARALEALAQAFDDVFRIWAGGEGFPKIRDMWLAHAWGLGESINVRLPETTCTGLFDGINDDGALRLRAPDGTYTDIAAGDVYFPKSDKTRGAHA